MIIEKFETQLATHYTMSYDHEEIKYVSVQVVQ